MPCPDIDPATLEAATSAVAAALQEEHGSAAGADDIARAALSVIPDAILEDAPMVVMLLNRVSDDEAEFTFAGGSRLVLNKGDWVERGRPSRLNVSIIDLQAMLT